MRSIPVFVLLTLLSIPFIQQWFSAVLEGQLYGAYHKIKRPEITWQSWFSGDFQREYDRWHRENFGFRSLLVRLHNQKDYSLYGKVHADSVVVGKDGYLFQREYLIAWSGTNKMSEKFARQMGEKLKSIQDALAKRGKTFVVVMAPGKASFFPEFVPAPVAAVRQPRNNSDIVSSLFPAMGINLINYNSEYVARKQTSPFPLFGQTGIHWSNYGAALSLQQFIAWLEHERGIDLPDLRIRNVRLSSSLRPPDGDLGELMNLVVHPQHFPMAVFDWDWEPAEGRQSLKLTTIADSFFQQFINLGIVPGCFREVDYFYYDSLVWHSSTSPASNIKWDQASKEAALKAVDESDVVLILATEQNYSGFGFDYLDTLTAHLNGPRVSQ